MANEIVLYDLPSRPPSHAWSLNPWKARLALNYKGLPYRTEWVEYPDLKPKFTSLGIPPNDKTINPQATFSSPAVKLPDDTYVMDSHKIAQALEELQPEPSLHFENGYTDRVQSTVLEINKALAPIALPRIPENLLNEPSAAYFRETRAKRFGMTLEELAKSDKAGETAWKNAAPGIEQLRAILRENPDGPYVMGKIVSFADFIIAGFFRFGEILDRDGDIFGRSMKIDENFGKHYEACKKWLERDY
ncbi:hypothetical protein LTR78_001337 [Recurvomyces mirabilis]|uniref:GST N-terminal domain-containing protein n=1 Tax=Recurvomyces mirabilis TaxID=574656 RepID=A0AAE1C5I5_9PEZI|nr:hypothetical protein LTR78_001337 [Recurvomyces mirabilis]KAK5161314.1 hypothetical protein LTS14_001110 [Recurvomyces mirabilis]